jgi:electron transfer flavoprotein beta subunit
MKILICYKWVLDEQDIKINRENQSLDSSKAKYRISEYDKNAIEEGMKLIEKHGGSLEAITFGTTGVKQSHKDCLSRGPDKVYSIGDPLAEKADASVIANVLAAAIKKIGPFDLIICGEGSADAYNQQVAPRISKRLNIPGITFVNKVEVAGDKVRATRKLGDCTEVVSTSGPAVISVMPEINKPRIPSLKQVLAAAKKPVQELLIMDLGLAEHEITPKVIRMSIQGFVMNRKNVIYKETNYVDSVKQLVTNLSKEGIC